MTKSLQQTFFSTSDAMSTFPIFLHFVLFFWDKMLFLGSRDIVDTISIEKKPRNQKKFLRFFWIF